ncbi:MAG: tetratricopeptide repeat-containing sulfotransferase family protein [Rhizomicrobium sp.]
MRDGFVGWKVEESWALPAAFKEMKSISAPGEPDPRRFMSLGDAERLLNSDLAAAEARGRVYLAGNPADSAASYLLGAALRRQGRHSEARIILEPLTDSQPQMGAAWRELGVVLAELGERPLAIGALLRTIDFDYTDKDAWYALGDLLPFPERVDEDATRNDSRLTKAEAALRERRVEIAETILRDLVEVRPTSAPAIKLLADIFVRTGRWAESEALLERCLELAPEFVAARFRYVTMRFAHRNVGGLLPHIDELLKSDPASTLYRSLKALVLWGNRQFVSAIAEFETFIAACERPGLWLEYARAQRAARSGDAIAAYRMALRLLPSFVDAYVSLANVKAFRMDGFIEAIRDQLARPGLPVEDRARLHYVLGKAFEDMERYGESFDNYRTSNEILRRARESGIENDNLYLRHAKTFFAPAFFRARTGFGYAERGPIFIVGMPRSGSTLVEQILSSHSAVEALGEIFDLPETGQRFAPDRPGDPLGGYPYTLNDLSAERFRLLGEQYMKATRSRRKSDKPFFTDKLPGNYCHVGLIHLALPNAKIIDVRRHPLDCCFSCFKHYFPAAQPQALDLQDIGRSYVDYVDLMAHFDEVLPGSVHRVFYENLIGNLETEVRRLLDYVGLPFEEQCLRFHENTRHVLTLSADQVHMPLYGAAIGHWRHYGQWLDPLKKALGYVLDAYPEVPRFYSEVHVESKNPLHLGQVSRRFAFVKGIGQAPFEIAAQSPSPSSGK